MYLFYLDESGDFSTLTGNETNAQPLFVIGGFIIHQQCIEKLTHDLIDLKKRFFPNRNNIAKNYWHEWLRIEIKGSDLRKYIREGKTREKRHAIGFIDNLLKILEFHNVGILARLYLKGVGVPFNGVSVYTSAVQQLADDFEYRLKTENAQGLIIADSRHKQANEIVSHSIFTQQFANSKRYASLVEVPLFGHSNNHAGIQCADYLCSSLLFPLAAYTYCNQLTKNIHVSAEYKVLQERFGMRLKNMQFRYQTEAGAYRGGFILRDPLAHRKITDLFGVISNPLNP